MRWLHETLSILKYAGPPALVALAASTVFDQLINQRLEVLLLSEDGMGAELWALATASLLNGLIFPVFITACCLYGIVKARFPHESAWHFFGRSLEQLYIETMRVWGSCLRWGLLFLIPGFIRLLQLVLVPFVVMADAAYDRGDADALKTSSRYFRRRPFKILGVVLLFHLALPLVLTDALDPWRTYWRTPLGALACNLLDLMLAIVSTRLLFAIFESVRRELKDESVFQLGRDQTPG